MQLRLTTGRDYQDDLAALRDTIRRNGTRATRHAVDLVIDDDAGAPRVSLLLNLAWQAAKNGSAVDASLYTLGFVGQSGRSTGPHVHYEVHINSTPVNPYKYLRTTLAQSEYTAKAD